MTYQQTPQTYTYNTPQYTYSQNYSHSTPQENFVQSTPQENYVQSNPQDGDDNLDYVVSYETDEQGRKVEVRRYKPGRHPSDFN